MPGNTDTQQQPRLTLDTLREMWGPNFVRRMSLLTGHDRVFILAPEAAEPLSDAGLVSIVEQPHHALEGTGLSRDHRVYQKTLDGSKIAVAYLKEMYPKTVL